MDVQRLGRRLRFGAIGVALAQLLASGALAQDYPNKEVQVIVGSAAGGGSDFIGRLISQELSKLWSQPVIVENRPGASQLVAAESVAKSAPDGYTLLMVTNTVLATALRSDITFDLEKDLAPLAMPATGPSVLVVGTQLPVHDVRELIAYAKERPGELNYGTGGVGSTGHFAGELFNTMAGVKMEHVPFNGGSRAAVAAAGGEIEVAYPGLVGTPPLVEAGKIRALAVTGDKRSSALPSVPTMAEAGLSDYEYVSWYGMFAPAGTPAELIEQLNEAINAVANNPEVKAALEEQGFDPQSVKPSDFADYIHARLDQNAELAKVAGIKPE